MHQVLRWGNKFILCIFFYGHLTPLLITLISFQVIASNKIFIAYLFNRFLCLFLSISMSSVSVPYSSELSEYELSEHEEDDEDIEFGDKVLRLSLTCELFDWRIFRWPRFPPSNAKKRKIWNYMSVWCIHWNTACIQVH